MMFLDCPAYLDQQGGLRCGLPAEVRCRFTMRSSDGPLESAMVRCPAGHWSNGPIGSLTWDRDGKHEPDPAAAASPGLPSLPGNPGPAGAGEPGGHDRGGRRRTSRRPSPVPAYYLGRPASEWVAALSPRPATAPAHLMAAVTGG
ncbi:MAG: hypothetical protein J2P35_23110 [Actinobacteria bacterium]|nr:hypothetical protein [Actinomycetota bacterium]